jgi:uncharacterized membrane protein YphA (DoxX/SURF4 family)
MSVPVIVSTVVDSMIMSVPAVNLVAVQVEATVGTLSALTLAAVLAVAAVMKLRRPRDTAREFAQLGLPMADRLATVVPVVELLAAAALLMRPMVGALVAGLLLVSFTLVLLEVVQNQEAGSEPVSCSCFGSLSRRPVSPATVARNIGLLTLAGMSALTPSLAAPDLASLVVVSTLAVVIAVAGQLLWMRSRIGALWSVQLAGELVADTAGAGGRGAGERSRSRVSEEQS